MNSRAPLTAVKQSVNGQIPQEKNPKHSIILYVIVLMYEFTKKGCFTLTCVLLFLPFSFRFAGRCYVIVLHSFYITFYFSFPSYTFYIISFSTMHLNIYLFLFSQVYLLLFRSALRVI